MGFLYKILTLEGEAEVVVNFLRSVAAVSDQVQIRETVTDCTYTLSPAAMSNYSPVESIPHARDREDKKREGRPDGKKNHKSDQSPSDYV